MDEKVTVEMNRSVYDGMVKFYHEMMVEKEKLTKKVNHDRRACLEAFVESVNAQRETVARISHAVRNQTLEDSVGVMVKCEPRFVVQVFGPGHNPARKQMERILSGIDKVLIV